AGLISRSNSGAPGGTSMQCRRYVWAGVMLVALCGCSPDVDELKRGDKEILAKIDAVQKSLDRAKGAAAPAAEPTPDPSKVYDIPFANNRDLSYDKLKEYAGKIGLNVVVWEEDFQALDVQQAISRDLRTGKAADVDGTPAFFVNGRRVMDRSFETFKTMIDDARRAATKKG